LTARALMLQGTGSDVGKSLLTAALCRIAARRGVSVAPFKPQNMSNNACACADGGEIGRAQALQARAAGVDPHTDMNPVLLKPQTNTGAQIVVHGRVRETAEACDYMAGRGRLLAPVLDSFYRLAAQYDLVLVEGAGSPAETNLRAGDIANMGFARAANIPVCIIGDIEKGGVIAGLVGTKAVLGREDADLIGGFVVNKFRGDPRLFDGGVQEIARRTGWACFGVVPWLPAASRLPAEDAVDLQSIAHDAKDGLVVAAPMLSRIANFDDADPIRLEPSVSFRWTPPGRPIPRDADIVILFGTKSTLGDLGFLRAQGWDHDIIAHARAGGRVLGVCGGYQMLGRRIADPDGIDGAPGEAEGLGLLNVDTVMTAEKRVAPAKGACALSGAAIDGYEIHMGRTAGPDTRRPFALMDDAPNAAPEGARSADGRVEGTYLHGVFASDAFRREWLARAGAPAAGGLDYDAEVDAALDALADHVECAVDVDALWRLARPPASRRAGDRAADSATGF